MPWMCPLSGRVHLGEQMRQGSNGEHLHALGTSHPLLNTAPSVSNLTFMKLRPLLAPFKDKETKVPGHWDIFPRLHGR